MILTLSDEETGTLKELLSDYLPELRREVARTDVKEFRHHLFRRQELGERLLGMLESREVASD